MTNSTKPQTRHDESAKIELDCAAWTAEREEKLRKHDELTRRDRVVVARFSDIAKQYKARRRLSGAWCDGRDDTTEPNVRISSTNASHPGRPQVLRPKVGEDQDQPCFLSSAWSSLS